MGSDGHQTGGMHPTGIQSSYEKVPIMGELQYIMGNVHMEPLNRMTDTTENISLHN